jgi:type II secretory ATPase GspE/PulE/Tfp pilus assembly ATPase PilB-like protein
VTDTLRDRYNLGDARLYEPRGCAACRKTGFRGRMGIFEMMPVTEELANHALEGITEELVHRFVGRPTLMQDGLQKVKAGLTSLSEMLRVIAG